MPKPGNHFQHIQLFDRKTAGVGYHWNRDKHFFEDRADSY